MQASFSTTVPFVLTMLAPIGAGLLMLVLIVLFSGGTASVNQDDMFFRSPQSGVERTLLDTTADPCTDPARFFCGGSGDRSPGKFWDAVRTAPEGAADACAWGAEHARDDATRIGAAADLSWVQPDARPDAHLIGQFFTDAPSATALRANPQRYPRALAQSTIVRTAVILSGARCMDAMRDVGSGTDIEHMVTAEVAAVVHGATIWPVLGGTHGASPLEALVRRANGTVMLPASIAHSASATSRATLFGRVASLDMARASALHDAAGDDEAFFMALGQAMCGSRTVGEVVRVSGYMQWCTMYEK